MLGTLPCFPHLLPVFLTAVQERLPRHHRALTVSLTKVVISSSCKIHRVPTKTLLGQSEHSEGVTSGQPV